MKSLITGIIYWFWVMLAIVASTRAAMGLSLAQIEALARQLTVRIWGPGDPGSGVIIAQQGTTYYVLTAAHVVKDILPGEEAEIQTPDRQHHRFQKNQIIPISSDTDLALVTFNSNRSYAIASLSNFQYQLYENRTYEIGRDQHSSRLQTAWNIQRRPFVFVAGFPNVEGQDLVVNPGILIDTSASAITNPLTRYQNYELVYSNLTYPGMSGGPVLDTLGRVIGIHGRADGKKIDVNDRIIQQFLEDAEAVERIKIGHSLGIPIHTFFNLARSSGITLNVNLSNTPPPPVALDLRQVWRPPLIDDLNNPVYWLELSNQQWRIGQIDAAQASLDRALQIRPNLYLAWFAKGFIAGFADDYASALTACNRAIAITPQYYDALRCRAGALHQLGQFAAALETLNQAIGLQSQRREAQNPNDFVTKAELLYSLQQYRGALLALEEARNLRQRYQLPPSARLQNTRGMILMAMQDYAAALTAFQEAARLDDHYATAWDNQAIALKRLDRYQEALVASDRAIALDATNPNIWNNRGTLLAALGRQIQAIAAFKEAIKLDPDYQPAIENLHFLESQ